MFLVIVIFTLYGTGTGTIKLIIQICHDTQERMVCYLLIFTTLKLNILHYSDWLFSISCLIKGTNKVSCCVNV